MGQLHEVLAVESELKNAAKKIYEETLNTFSKKPGHFQGVLKTLRMFDDSRSNEEAAQCEHKELVTTVGEKLEYISKSLVQAIDASAQKEATNQAAVGNVTIDNNIVLANVPATLLLTLEKELVSYRNLYNTIPTLEPGVIWESDEVAGDGVFKTKDPVIRSKTEKMRLHKEISPATKEHKAQIEQWTEDRPVGEYSTTFISGMISPARKAVLLGRIDQLILAVKKARTRANKQEIVDIHVGQKLFDFINA
jgi:hypothetical protein